MRAFACSCIDQETGLEMVVRECSYNMACDWLSRNGFTEPAKTSVTDGGRYITVTFTAPAARTFVYDEHRGYLLATR